MVFGLRSSVFGPRDLTYVAALVLVLVAGPPSATAQVQGKFPPDSFVNLKVFPKAIPARDLIDMMRGFTRALGVRCSTCHKGEEDMPLEKYDFPSDDKLLKRKAREMIRMVNTINEQLDAKLEKRVGPPLKVQCFTCHHGVREPRLLADILLTAYKAGGYDSTITAYKTLRDRYYGRAAYDFGEVALADVANGVIAAGQLPDAVKLLELNVQMNPSSVFAQRFHANRAVELAFDRGAPDSAAAVYRDLKSRYQANAVGEETLNTVGYALLGRGRTAQAVAALRLNTELYPQSANAYDSFGEVLAAAGDTARAIANYQRSVDLNPDNEAAKKKLGELRRNTQRPASNAKGRKS
jgi:tetratricopeptide (TPR) repeat protein